MHAAVNMVVQRPQARISDDCLLWRRQVRRVAKGENAQYCSIFHRPRQAVPQQSPTLYGLCMVGASPSVQSLGRQMGWSADGDEQARWRKFQAGQKSIVWATYIRACPGVGPNERVCYAQRERKRQNTNSEWCCFGGDGLNSLTVGSWSV